MLVKLKLSKSRSNTFQVWHKFRYLLDGFNLLSQEFVEKVWHLQQGGIHSIVLYYVAILKVVSLVEHCLAILYQRVFKTTICKFQLTHDSVLLTIFCMNAILERHFKQHNSTSILSQIPFSDWLRYSLSILWHIVSSVSVRHC